jgi:hypothetical protein
MKTGFIRLYRTIFENELWTEERPRTMFEAWIDLIRSARFEEHPTNVLIHGRRITIKQGEFHASLRYLSDRWGWGVTKVNNFLNRLSQDGMVEIRRQQGETILFLVNFGKFNGFRRKKHPDATPNTTPKSGKKPVFSSVCEKPPDENETPNVTSTKHRRNTDVTNTRTRKNLKKEEERKEVCAQAIPDFSEIPPWDETRIPDGLVERLDDFRNDWNSMAGKGAEKGHVVQIPFAMDSEKQKILLDFLRTRSDGEILSFLEAVNSAEWLHEMAHKKGIRWDVFKAIRNADKVIAGNYAISNGPEERGKR